MTTQLIGTAHAKLNLTLDVVRIRPDGYHDLQMVMQEIALGDRLTLTLGTGKPWTLACTDATLPCDSSNLAMKAARLFFEQTGIDCGGLSIFLEKHTPVQAGMGGGSADGAEILRLLQAHYGDPLPQRDLFALAEQTGSDVPFALLGHTALAGGKGQILSPLPSMPHSYIVLCKPPFPISTPALFSEIDRHPVSCQPDTKGMIQALERGDLSAIGQKLYNVFTPLVQMSHPEIADILAKMRDYGALGAEMTGSGPTIFGLFAEQSAAAQCCNGLKTEYADCFLTEPV